MGPERRCHYLRAVTTHGLKDPSPLVFLCPLPQAMAFLGPLPSIASLGAPFPTILLGRHWADCW